jgi:ankyrin repeat protein
MNRLTEACKDGDIEAVWLLLADTRVDPGTDENIAIRVASENNHLEIVRVLLANKGKVDPSDKDNDALVKASKCGHYHVAELLLSDNRVARDIDRAFRKAAENSQHKIVELLLAKARPWWQVCGYNNELIRWASHEGYTETVRMLLGTNNVDPSAFDNEALCLAIAGNRETALLLLSSKLVDPSARNNYAIGQASKRGYDDIVELLLCDKRVIPSANNNYAIQWASANGHVKVVQLLLDDGRVDPSANFNIALGYALFRGHESIANQLRSDPRVFEDRRCVYSPVDGWYKTARLRELPDSEYCLLTSVPHDSYYCVCVIM